MHNFQSPFCQSLYVHTILGLARGKRPIAYRKIGISKLFTHNFRPCFGLNLQKYIISKYITSGDHKEQPFFL